MRAPTRPGPDMATEFERRVVAEIPRLRAFLARLAGAEADDLCQETLARALRYRAAYRPDQPLLAWLQRTGFRAFLDLRRRRRADPESAGGGDVAQPDPRIAAERRLWLEQGLAGLRPVERDVLMRFHGRGESVAEIARGLCMAEGTVKSHLHRARRRLAEELQ